MEPVLTRLERSRVAVLKTLIDACAKHSVDVAPIISAITDSFSCSSQELIFKMLHLKPEDLLPPPETAGPTGKPKRDPNQLHGALLAQTFLSLSAEAAAPICESILSQPQDTIVGLCKHPQASHVVQKLFNSPTATMPNKRKLLNILKGRFVELSLDTIASHIVDTCWDSPMNYRQPIAEELLRGEPQMRESYSGRAVWRNWCMDKYKTQRKVWYTIGKEEAAAAANQGKGAEKKKTAIELARERHAAQKVRGFGTGANSGGKRSAAEMGTEVEKKKRRVK
jgi:nucleolar protein 9